MKVVLRISYLAMSPVDTPSLLAGACPVRGKAGFAHGVPAGTCPVRGKSGFAHGIPAGACLAGEEDSSKVKVFRAKMVENLKRFS